MIPWPAGFSGIEVAMGGDRDLVKWMINVLLTCGHDHNFGVELDGNMVHVSVTGQRCIGEAIIRERDRRNLRRGEAVSEV